MPSTIRDIYGHDAHKGRDIGIEIELEGANLGVECAGWEAHSDGSLRPNPESVEYVLARPYPHRDVASLLSTLQVTLEKNGAKLNLSDRCGVHIHINCQQLTVSQVMCFICAYLILEEALVKWCGEDREGNLFTLRAKDAEGLVGMLITAANAENFNNFNSEYRYSSINVASLLKFGSLEFRSLRTTKDFAVINTWANMLMRIKEYAITFKHPREIIEGVSAGGFMQFPKTVLGDMAELIQCKGLGITVAEGARRVQEIAYVDLVYKKKERPADLVLEEQPFVPQQQHNWQQAYHNEVIDPVGPPPARELTATQVRNAQQVLYGGNRARPGNYTGFVGTRLGTIIWDEETRQTAEAPPITPAVPIAPNPRRTRDSITTEMTGIQNRYTETPRYLTNERDALARRYSDLYNEREGLPR